ncbi:MAG: M48 family metalloprotease [Burkholderiaceae bacterium]
MKALWLYSIGLACLCQVCLAEVTEVPVTGRWGDLAYSSAEVHRVTLDKYNDILSSYSGKHQLDDDNKLMRRVKAISKTLIKAAIALKPAAKDWAWEIHTTSDPQVDAFCMAGGKLMVGSVFVNRLKLHDGELAMLIAHEVAHAVAEHHREELAEVLLINGRKASTPAITMEQLDTDFSIQVRLFELSSIQESEADHVGMILAHMAGWQARDILSFYNKLASSDSSSMLNGAYPSMSSRLSMAKGMAQLFEKKVARTHK